MAKKRRRRKATSLSPAKKQPRKKKPESLDGMKVPNHMVPRYLTKVPGADKLRTHRYPLLHIHKPEHEDSGTAVGLAFVDDVYGLVRWVDRDIEAPPTWMDPEIFIRMVVTDPRVRTVCERYRQKKSAGNYQALLELLDEIFEEAYMVYMFEQFQGIRKLVAEWTVAHHVTEAETPEPRVKKKVKKVKRRKARPT